MIGPFFKQPIIHSPYECPARHRELDPADMLAEPERVRTVITDFHASGRREAAALPQDSPKL